SPEPYLFGGLIATMSGLIAFALIILACFYRKPCWELDNEATGRLGCGGGGGEERAAGEEDYRVLVIMAGNEQPTFLATPL
ncbi:hypothetical protein M569_15758, partial [Genlisea aurea]